MLTKRGPWFGSQGLKFLCVTLLHLTPPKQFAMCDALIDLVATEIISYMTPENVVEEIFCDPPPCVPSPITTFYTADN